MAYDDLKEYGTEAAVKAAGKLRQHGKPCELFSPSLPWVQLILADVMNDGDIAYWKCGQ
jgi:obg-like ATPase 1